MESNTTNAVTSVYKEVVIDVEDLPQIEVLPMNPEKMESADTNASPSACKEVVVDVEDLPQIEDLAMNPEKMESSDILSSDNEPVISPTKREADTSPSSSRNHSEEKKGVQLDSFEDVPHVLHYNIKTCNDLLVLSGLLAFDMLCGSPGDGSDHFLCMVQN
ncbi:hypothetical protein CDAR_453561 [Caerostris darwini]|uniref:Uncharacterized protein n=1 Tax=Caerostris darwini TaxID=1538125 RepID=A0AAV4VWJ1_9ARAC|nr:hypothetical protein CDAR_453561 [Caerostris darwini]